MKNDADEPGVTGRTFVLQRDILIADVGLVKESLSAFETGEEGSLRKRGQFRSRLAKGGDIKIAGVFSRRLEPGIFRYYRCRSDDPEVEFSLPFSMRDSLGLPEYKSWP